MDITCSKCLKPKKLLEMSVGISYKQCKKCIHERHISRLNSSQDYFLRHRESQIRSRCGRAGIEYSLPDGFIVELFHSQKGRCFYTGVEMVCVIGEGYRRHWNAVSVDRLIPEIGYVVGNVVLCCNRANTVKANVDLKFLKTWIPQWYQRIVDKHPELSVE